MNDPLYEPEGSEEEHDDEEGDNNPEGGDDAQSCPKQLRCQNIHF